jgi:hypothetical protein
MDGINDYIQTNQKTLDDSEKVIRGPEFLPEVDHRESSSSILKSKAAAAANNGRRANQGYNDFGPDTSDD